MTNIYDDDFVDESAEGEPVAPVAPGQIALAVLARVRASQGDPAAPSTYYSGEFRLRETDRDRLAIAAVDAQLAQVAATNRLAEAVEAFNTGIAVTIDRATEQLAAIGGELGNIDVRLDTLADRGESVVEAVDGVHDVLVDVRHEVASLVAGVDSGVEIAETVVYGRRRWPVRVWQAATGWWRRRRAGQAAEVSPAEVTEVQSAPPSADEIKAMAQSVVEEEWADWQQIWGRWDRAMDAAEQRAAYRWTWWPVWWRQAITAWWRRRRGVDPAGVLVVRDEVHDLLAGGAPAGADLAEANRQLITLENALARYEQGQGRDSDG